MKTLPNRLSLNTTLNYHYYDYLHPSICLFLFSVTNISQIIVSIGVYFDMLLRFNEGERVRGKSALIMVALMTFALALPPAKPK